jgi:biofilm PGA synthesis N-glycosyltransferase PgaC
MPPPLEYVLITPARNEAEFIAATIESVVAQTVHPLKWVIVSDGSTDDTDDIVDRYAESYSWIELIRMPVRRERSFGGKAHAVNRAYSHIRDSAFQAVAIIDADISLRPDHFAYLLTKLAEDPQLGLVGAPFQEISGESYDYRFVSLEHVSGACQVFRRDCFEAISGYTPLKGGGIDHVAVISARMKGWKTRTFTEIRYLHHRKIGSAEHGAFASWFRAGAKDYIIGGHPAWELVRVLRQISQRPLLLRGIALGAGYLWSMARRTERTVPAEIRAFHRHEQTLRLRNLLLPRTVFRSGRFHRPA